MVKPKGNKISSFFYPNLSFPYTPHLPSHQFALHMLFFSPVTGRAKGRDEAIMKQILDDCVEGSVVLRKEGRNEGRRES